MTIEELIGMFLNLIEMNIVRGRAQEEEAARRDLKTLWIRAPKETAGYFQDRVDGIIEYADTEEEGKRRAKNYLADMLASCPKYKKQVKI